MSCKICNKEIGKGSRGTKNKSGLCDNCRVKKWVAEHRARSNEIKRIYTVRNPEVRKQSVIKHRNKNIKQRNAWAVLEYHVKNGDIVKPDACERCGSKQFLYAHHPDYAKPLLVIWVCPPCHKIEHGYQVYAYA